MTDKKQILKSASIITLVTIISRILGYVRDQRIAVLLGTTEISVAYQLAFRIPNLFRRLVAEGAMTASFIPVFANYMGEKDPREVWDFANKLFWTLALVVAVITVLGMVFSPYVIHLFTSDVGSAGGLDLAVGLNRIIFPYLFFVALAALADVILDRPQGIGKGQHVGAAGRQQMVREPLRALGSDARQFAKFLHQAGNRSRRLHHQLHILLTIRQLTQPARRHITSNPCPVD